MPQTPAPRSVQVRTLGCRLNKAESDEIRAALAARRVESTDIAPELVVVNTCTVTAEASKASRRLIRRSIADHPHSKIIVTGCYAVAEPEIVAAIPGVDLVVSNQDKNHLASLVAGEVERLLWAGVPGCTRANLRIQTGCDELCTFCIVPRTRGELFSRTEEDVVAAARAMAEAGTREVILTGVHLGKYGWDRTRERRLVDLIGELAALPGLERIRLSSIEASQVDGPFLEALAAEPKVCRHLHIPLQTGDAELWKAMRRPGTLEHFLEIAERAKEMIEDLTLTTDVMVGFPGENERAFANTLAVTEMVGFRKLHVFRFSPRAGTPAATDPRQVDGPTIRDRSERVRGLGTVMRAQWLKAQEGKRVQVLIEKAGPANEGPSRRSRLSGLTDNYLRVNTTGPADLVGRFATVLVTSSGEDSVEGDIVG
ncbi:MAG: MiaB/RimO family radical SAM methylthiotransferase [Acidimicrobiia bacterium]|nr:MiaB/RimO family radical SAM methylthiotransferase [Acidimicrobiia bacterium]